MTNKSFDKVKIGYSKNPEVRCKQLSSWSGLPDEFELYAKYETYKNNADLVLHAIIDNLNPNLRYKTSREFYQMSPQAAYDLLERIAIISGTTNRLKKVSATRNSVRRSPTSYGNYGFPNEPKRPKNPFRIW